jgi:hypothetical protein
MIIQTAGTPLYQFLRKRLFGYGASEAQQTKSCAACFGSGQSSAGAGTQPSGYERSKKFHHNTVMVEQKKVVLSQVEIQEKVSFSCIL